VPTAERPFLFAMQWARLPDGLSLDRQLWLCQCLLVHYLRPRRRL
jgi:hypothetical protein